MANFPFLWTSSIFRKGYHTGHCQSVSEDPCLFYSSWNVSLLTAFSFIDRWSTKPINLFVPPSVFHLRHHSFLHSGLPIREEVGTTWAFSSGKAHNWMVGLNYRGGPTRFVSSFRILEKLKTQSDVQERQHRQHFFIAFCSKTLSSNLIEDYPQCAPGCFSKENKLFRMLIGKQSLQA